LASASRGSALPDAAEAVVVVVVVCCFVSRVVCVREGGVGSVRAASARGVGSGGGDRRSRVAEASGSRNRAIGADHPMGRMFKFCVDHTARLHAHQLQR
jgi:hypothetical protein